MSNERARLELLNDKLTFEEAEIIQKKYQKVLEHEQRVKKDAFGTGAQIRWICGVDVAYKKFGENELGLACASLWDINYKKEIDFGLSVDFIDFPYKPGFLGFRECRLMAESIWNLTRSPDTIMCDGHGIIHPYRFGEAAQLGYALNVPSFGVAKNPFIGYSNWKNIKRTRGSKVPVWSENPEQCPESNNQSLGFAVCLQNDLKPVFISVGHDISIETAIDLSLKLTVNHRQPEPLFAAHSRSETKIMSYRNLTKDNIQEVRKKIKEQKET